MTTTATQPTMMPPPHGAGADTITAFIVSAHPMDVASWLDQLPRASAWQYLSDVEVSRRVKVFASLPLDVQADLARAASRPELVEIISAMDADDRVDLFNVLTVEEQQALEPHLESDDRADIRHLSTYDEGTAGALMTSNFATLSAGMTGGQAIAALRRAAPGSETIYRSYILDKAGRLIGSVRLHELILLDEDHPIAEMMEKTPIAVTPDMGQEDVAKTIARYDLLAVPVVDADNRLVGIVTHDDATDAMQAETTEDFQRISTVLPFTESLRAVGVGVLYSKRIVWLALLVFGNLFSGAGIAYFEEMILAYVSLVFFLPLLIDSSGNAGSQSATLMVRALATGDVALSDWRNLILRELVVAAALGATMALVVLPLGAWRGGPDVALVVGLTMFCVVIVGSLVGMSLPFVLSRLRLDPATASGPLVTTISDGVGVLLYFSVATLILSG
ncbi:magnesium transporter [uncultured Aliiroseovarius sp.]|uniref:magnesium transporter n=1 Tax=uncultured Aliiroseovarius sp. TaxID=1658783 RepID=UPI00259A51E5|nr:magnesium transporter [uncultured Aliiroseovarius sp.]